MGSRQPPPPTWDLRTSRTPLWHAHPEGAAAETGLHGGSRETFGFWFPVSRGGGVRRGRGLAGGPANGPEDLVSCSHGSPQPLHPMEGWGAVRKVGFEGRGAGSKPAGGGLSMRGTWGRSCEDPEPHGLAAWWEQERPWDTGGGVRSEHMFPAPARRLSAGRLERRSWAGRNSDGRVGREGCVLALP